AEVGAHILSGAVIDPSGIDALLPGWRETEPQALGVPVAGEDGHIHTKTNACSAPHLLLPPLMQHRGCHGASLANVGRGLGDKAAALGVEIYPGFAATELLFTEEGAVAGVETGDVGLDKDGRPGPSFQPGVEIRGRYTILAEGARGSLSKQA